MSDRRASGCGIQVLYNGVFGRKGVRPRRTVSTSSIPIHKSVGVVTSSKLKRVGSKDNALIFDTTRNSVELPLKVIEKPFTKPTNLHQRRSSSGTNTTTTSPSSNDSKVVRKAASAPELVGRRSLSKAGSIVSEELGSTVTIRPKGTNVLVSSNLGKQPGNSSDGTIVNTNNSVIGNLVKNGKTLSKGLIPDRLKLVGNEEYKKGRFSEALVLYEGAISLNHDYAPYRYNKSAALVGLGRLLEAIFECREAVKIDPTYQRAHHRLASLYIRLGEGDKALYHFKQSGFEAESSEISKAQILQAHLVKCIEAKKQLEWKKLLRETESAISLGADSAPQLFSLQAEALLKLRRHKDADSALTKGPHFDVDSCTKFFGPIKTAQLLMIHGQVDLAAGRFDAAVMAAEQAFQLDPNNKEVSLVVRMVRAVSSARSNGNNLFKASKYSKAIITYTEGLEHEPLNSVLLCNRAACRIKLGHFEKAMEDCTFALNVRPSYTKARLRRAECNAKMERWMASIQDYEILIREFPGDEELGRAMLEAQAQLKKQRSQDLTIQADVSSISNKECFQHLITPAVQCVHVGG